MVVGMGESGLDYFYDFGPRDRQAASYPAHIAAARETGLPLVVHTRDADDDTMAPSGSGDRGRGPSPASFTASAAAAASPSARLHIGLYLGIGGI